MGQRPWQGTHYPRRYIDWESRQQNSEELFRTEDLVDSEGPKRFNPKLVASSEGIVLEHKEPKGAAMPSSQALGLLRCTADIFDGTPNRNSGRNVEHHCNRYRCALVSGKLVIFCNS